MILIWTAPPRLYNEKLAPLCTVQCLYLMPKTKWDSIFSKSWSMLFRPTRKQISLGTNGVINERYQNRKRHWMNLTNPSTPSTVCQQFRSKHSTNTDILIPTPISSIWQNATHFHCFWESTRTSLTTGEACYVKIAPSSLHDEILYSCIFQY